MDLLALYGPFVKDQIHVQEKLAERYSEQEWRATRHQRNVVVCRSLLRDLEMVQERIKSMPPGGLAASVVSSGLQLAPEDLDGLPTELMEQLTITERETKEFAIIDLINKSGGILPVNKIIIGLYRKTGEINNRAALISKLHRMVAKGRLHTNPQDRRGVFSTKPLNEVGKDNLRDDEDEDHGENSAVPQTKIFVEAEQKPVKSDVNESSLRSLRRRRRARVATVASLVGTD